jgi:NTE family protein
VEVLLRRDEIVYSERIRNDVRTRNLLHDFHKLVEEILGEVTPDKLMQIKQRPRYIQLMGDIAPIAITCIVREVVEDEPLSKDYDFSAMSIEQHKTKRLQHGPAGAQPLAALMGFPIWSAVYAGVF